MKIVAFAASSSKHSINKQLLGYAARLLDGGLIADTTVEIIDLKAHLSIPNFYENFDTETGTLTNPDLDPLFRAALAGFSGS